MEQEKNYSKTEYEDGRHSSYKGNNRQWNGKLQIRMSDIVFAVKKHLILVIVCMGIGLVAGVCLSVVSYMKGEINKQYAITTDIAVTSQNANGLFTAQSNNPDSADIYLAEEMVDSVIFVLKSDRTLNEAVKKLDLLGVSTKDIANNLSMTRYNETQVIQITLYWRSAQEGVEILTAINEVAPQVLIDTLKIGGVSVINEPKSKYLIGGNINASMWVYMMVLGAVVGVGIAILELLIHPTLLSTRDVERHFGVEILAEIPDKKGYFKKKRNLLMDYADDEDNIEVIDNYSSLAHILRTRLSKLEHPCVYVTSAAQNEGKTTTTSRLAVQLSELGMKVLLVDLDTRNPKLGGLFIGKLEYEHSLNALYRGETNKEEAITSLTGNLDILPAILERKPLPYDLSLLDMISDLKNDYDVILMDTPPVGQVADTMGLNHLADVALLVVRFDGASLDIIQDALDRLDKSRTKIIGCVVNGVKALGKTGYYNGSDYGRYGVHSRGIKKHGSRQKTEQEQEWELWDKARFSDNSDSVEQVPGLERAKDTLDNTK